VIAGIILAAGASTRMGSPKALLDYRGETFVERLVRLFARVCNPVIVVLGEHPEPIRARVEGRAEIVINPDPDRGQLSSLQTALAALPPKADGFLFTTVDCPAVEPETVSQIVARFKRRDPATLLVIPAYRGRHGHPVCAASALADEFLALSPKAQARDVVHRHLAETVYIDVDDAGILVDVDDAEAYRRMTEKLQ
jgi:molybdenum cofactor cytidylyltransferase